jgi:hypothetical protein
MQNRDQKKFPDKIMLTMETEKSPEFRQCMKKCYDEAFDINTNLHNRCIQTGYAKVICDLFYNSRKRDMNPTCERLCYTNLTINRKKH